MRDYPAGWPDPSDKNQTVPKVYLNVLDSVWPPAATYDGEDLPDGWSLCGAPDENSRSWWYDAALDAPLLPGQVNLSTSTIEATGGCLIPQPRTGMFAPWRPGNEQTPDTKTAQLIASYDGYDGSSAFLIGQFRLDPLAGAASEGWLTVTMVQDIVRLNKPHGVPEILQVVGPISPTQVLDWRATANGFTLDASADFPTVITSSYFPGKTKDLAVMQQIVAANLGAMFLSLDGTTLVVKDPVYLQGRGAAQGTLIVEDELDDVPWKQDPNALVDRIEVKYIPPVYNGSPLGPVPYDAAAAWTAPEGATIAAGGINYYAFDPEHSIRTFATLTPLSATVYANTAPDGSGTSYDLPVILTVLSSGSYSMSVHNFTPSDLWLVAPYYAPPAYGFTDYTKGTRAFLPGIVDTSTESDSGRMIAWGVAADDAANVLSLDLGRNIQRDVDAQSILAQVVDRITHPTFTLEQVLVAPDLRRELADIFLMRLPAAGFNVRSMVTGVSVSGSPSSIQQSLTVAAFPLTLGDLDDAVTDAYPGGTTLGTLDDLWVGAVLGDIDDDPLRAT